MLCDFYLKIKTFRKPLVLETPTHYLKNKFKPVAGRRSLSRGRRSDDDGPASYDGGHVEGLFSLHYKCQWAIKRVRCKSTGMVTLWQSLTNWLWSPVGCPDWIDTTVVTHCVWAAITKYCRLGGLYTTEIYFSQFWGLKIQNQGASIESGENLLLG